jgi:PAS domain S-box-containing protein
MSSDSMISKALEHSPDLVLLVDSTGQVVFANRHAREMGQSSNSSYLQLICEDDHPTMESGLAETLRCGGQGEWDAQLSGPSGFRVYSFRMVKLEVALVAIFGSDVSEQRRAQKALQSSEEQYRAVFQAINDGLIINSLDGQIKEVNRAACEMHGWSREEFLKLDPSGFIHPDSMEDFADYVKTTRRGESFSCQARDLHKDGTAFDIEVRGFPFRYQGEPHILGVVRDITEQKRLSVQLQQAQKMEALGKLTGGIAHDFNNLLTVVLGNLALIEVSLDNAEMLKEYLRRATHATDKASTLTHRLLAYSRQQSLRPRSVNLSSLVKGMESMLAHSLGETIHVVTRTATELWDCRVDPSQLENSLLNLAINARDAMPNGGQLTIEVSNITLDSEQASEYRALPGDYVQLTVTDTGDGMSPEIIAQVFEPFFTTKDVGKGSGLGLSMVYGFVKQSKGFIDVASRVGRGTKVRLTFPRADSKGRTARTPGQSKAKRERGEDRLVLVVEDNLQVREVTTALLQDLGYQTIAAESAEPALGLLKANPDVSLVLSDVVLPGGVNGIQLAEQIRQHRPGLPILFTSGYSEAAFGRTEGSERELSLLTKPFTKNELAAAVQESMADGANPATE